MPKGPLGNMNIMAYHIIYPIIACQVYKALGNRYLSFALYTDPVLTVFIMIHGVLLTTSVQM